MRKLITVIGTIEPDAKKAHEIHAYEVDEVKKALDAGYVVKEVTHIPVPQNPRAFVYVVYLIKGSLKF